ncbi:helix-turn-helix transcriptional regulator [Rhizobium ruizarguesonis]
MAGDKLLRPKTAAAKLGLGVRTFYREISLGNLPKGIPITDRAVGWRESVIEQVIADREAGKRSSTDSVASERRKPGRPRKLPVADDADTAENTAADRHA